MAAVTLVVLTFGLVYAVATAREALIERLRSGAALNAWDMKTWFSQGPEGYTDYPALAEQEAA